MAVKGVLEVTRRLRRGDDVECPVCGATASSFLRNRCPTCSAAPRQRLLALFLQRECSLGGGAPLRILHFAPEPSLIPFLSGFREVDYVPGDLVPDKGHVKVDATDIQLELDFDGIISSHVLEHIPDDAAAISEMHRVLKPGGWAIVMLPYFNSLSETYENDSIDSAWQRHLHFGQHDHVRAYGRDLVNRLAAPGFDVSERVFADEVESGERKRFGLRPADVIFFCRKPI
jgi:SAM-dependent methyltransferase